MKDDMMKVSYVDRALSDDELRQATEVTRRDELNDAITAAILNQLGAHAEMVGDAIVIPGRGATDVDLLIDVERIIDAILPVIEKGTP